MATASNANLQQRERIRIRTYTACFYGRGGDEDEEGVGYDCSTYNTDTLPTEPEYLEICDCEAPNNENEYCTSDNNGNESLHACEKHCILMTTSDDPTTWNESNCYYDSCMSGNNDDWYDCMDALDITISATNTLNEVNHNADQCGLTYTPDFVDSSMDASQPSLSTLSIGRFACFFLPS